MLTSDQATPIKLLLSDVDGVLTDGGLTFDSSGGELKTFNVRDGLGIRLWQQLGGEFGIITGRLSSVVEKRADELDVVLLKQGIGNKLPIVEEIANEKGLSLEAIAYIGDDLPDLPVIEAVGLGVAVADAAAEVRAGADWVTSISGGKGAVRELVESILKASGRWAVGNPSASKS